MVYILHQSVLNYWKMKRKIYSYTQSFVGIKTNLKVELRFLVIMDV